MKIAVLGAGAWGTAIGISLARRHAVTLWARDAGQCAVMRSTRANERYLPGFALPAGLVPEEHLPAAIAGCGLVLVAVTTAGLRETLARLRQANSTAPVVWLCKGFEREHAKLPHEVCSEELEPHVSCGVLSGPSFAEEVARGLPTAMTLATTDPRLGREAVQELHGTALRIYSSDDVIGVEIAGAVKNVMAIATGVSDGLALGLNARAALMTRGLAEITRLGVRMGGRIETFMGLAGVGDLFLTCTGDLSRNRRVGLGLGRGMTLAEVLAQLGHVAEGVYSAREVSRIANELGIDMPITQAVCRVLDEPRAASAIVHDLLLREPKSEY